jgi:protoheme ferro-lyase
MSVYQIESKLKKIEEHVTGKSLPKIGMIFLRKDETLEEAKEKYKGADFPVFFFNLHGEDPILETVKELLASGVSRDQVKAVIEEEQPGAAEEILKGI